MIFMTGHIDLNLYVLFLYIFTKSKKMGKNLTTNILDKWHFLNKRDFMKSKNYYIISICRKII